MNAITTATVTLAAAGILGCGAKPVPAPSAQPARALAVQQNAARPRFSPDGALIAFHAGASGARDIYVMHADGSNLRRVTTSPSDDIDAAWGPDGERLVFASNRAGDAATGYDLYVVDARGGEPQRITNLPGDETEPSVAALRYAFYAVSTDGCSSEGASGHQIDGYEKVVFTRRYEDRAEVWFASVAPTKPPAGNDWRKLEQVSPHATHGGRLSPDGARCGQPAFSGDGLSVVWSCADGGSTVYDNSARWDQSFAAALAVVSDQPPTACLPETFDEQACFAVLPRRYTTYHGPAASDASAGLARPAVSANQVVLLADVDGRAMHRERATDGATWQPFATDAHDVRNVVWSPDGTRIAFDAAGDGNRRRIVVLPTDFYLQEVRNLNQFPELVGAQRSRKLHDNRFVARQGTEKEFYALYDKLRYARRPQFVTADAALQVFRDELLLILQSAERDAAERLRALSKAMADHYAARYARTRLDSDRYYAAYFATAWVPLEAAATMELPDMDDYMAARYDDRTPEEQARFERISRPPVERLPEAAQRLLPQVAQAVRGDVGRHLEQIFAHAGIGELAVPARTRPAKLDWSQFRVRGSYADNELAGYFVAMSWYAQAPMVFDDSLAELLAAMEKVQVGDGTALDAWRRIDGTVGAFMGKPVDATIAHLLAVRAERPELLTAPDAAPLAARLEELRGPMPLRDAEAVEAGGGEGRRIQVTLLPKRMGLDTTFFAGLTHPRVPNRGMPSALDVMAVLGGARARALAEAAQDRATADAYRAALDELTQRTPTPSADPAYWSTDVYHSWLAALVALANANDVPADSLMRFARSEAWRDRLLSSALAGYAQLKHAAVLYNMQDMSAECGSEDAYYVAIEQPILPRPRGFVDPTPTFFDALDAVATRVYTTLYDKPQGPSVGYWSDADEEAPLNAGSFARSLAEIARREVAGEPLTDEQLAWIEYVGSALEQLTLRAPDQRSAFAAGSNVRAERGIALITDIHTAVTRQQVLELGIGRLFDLFVAVPDRVGQTMTQGGAFSFYELTAPMSARMTDEEWAKRVNAGELPALPAWTESFVEPARR